MLGNDEKSGEEMYFKVRLADLVIGVKCQYETTKRFCGDYLVEDGAGDVVDDIGSINTVGCEVDFEVNVVDDDIENERRISEDSSGNRERMEYQKEYRKEYLETLALLRKISNRLPEYNCFLMHGAVVSVNGSGYMFTAPSGTGKSTHVALWKKYFENAEIINGDKPFIRVDESGVWVYGMPWAGKEGWQKNVAVPLRGICLLGRGEENRIEPVSPMQVLPYIMRQIHYTDEPKMAGRTLELLNEMMADVPVYRLECDMSREAAECSYAGMVEAGEPEPRANGDGDSGFFDASGGVTFLAGCRKLN